MRLTVDVPLYSRCAPVCVLFHASPFLQRFIDKICSIRFSVPRVIGAVNMSSSDKIPPVLGSPSAPDAAGVAAEVAATAGATEASAPDAVVADVAAASGVVDGAAPTVAAPKVAAGGRYAMERDTLRHCVACPRCDWCLWRGGSHLFFCAPH